MSMTQQILKTTPLLFASPCSLEWQDIPHTWTPQQPQQQNYIHMNEKVLLRTLHSHNTEQCQSSPRYIRFQRTPHYCCSSNTSHQTPLFPFVSIRSLKTSTVITKLCSASVSLGLAGAWTPAIRACIGLSWSPTAGWTDGDMLPHCWR